MLMLPAAMIKESFTEDDSSVAEPGQLTVRVGSGVYKILKKALNKSYHKPITSPRVARKLKALEEDVSFHYSILKDAQDMLKTEITNITQQLKNENKCYTVAQFDALENECSLLKTKLQKVEQENQKLKSDIGEHEKKKKQSKISSLHESTTTPSHLPNGHRHLQQLEHPPNSPIWVAHHHPLFQQYSREKAHHQQEDVCYLLHLSLAPPQGV